MLNNNSEIIYKSKLSLFNLALMIFGSIFFIGMGTNLLISTQHSRINWAIILPLSFILFGIFILYYIFTVNTIIITKDYLILNYPVIGKKKNIKWKSITDAEMSFITTKTSGSDYHFRIGKEIRLFSDGKNYRIVSFSVADPDQLIIQIKKRLDSKLKSKMKKEYLESEKKFWKSEDEYRKWIWKYILPVCIIIAGVLLLFRDN